MPEGFVSARPYPGKRYRLRDAANDGQLLVVRCRRCRRSARYLASDLVTILDPMRDAALPPFPCSKCEREDTIKVTFHSPSVGDYGHLVVRRPAGVRTIQMWKSVRLGD
jgi:hypothetical protein